MLRIGVLLVTIGLAVPACAGPSPEISSPPVVSYTIIARGSLFNVYDVHVAEGRPLILRFVNADAGEWHGLIVRRYDEPNAVLDAGTIRGVAQRTVELGRLPKGLYGLNCPIQPAMNAILTID